MFKYQLIFLFFALPLLGFQVPQNQMADVLLNALTDEQKVSTYSLAKSIGSLSDTTKIKLIFNDGSTSNYKVDYLLSAFRTIAQNAENSDKSDKLAEHLRLSTRLKIKEIKGIKLFVFNTSGERIIKFESAGLKIGKRKIGPFEIPSNKILIVSPGITYY
tara:strand:- start:656 stop:1135 length:480 start_codon:yes stop_codon:yes gene_type:complete